MLENFKRFIKANPKLINYVRNNNTSWQELYEIYVLYGEDKNIWEKYIIDKDKSIDELLKLIKNVNLESIKNTVEGLQKAISILQSITTQNVEQTYDKRRKYEDLDD